MLRDASQLLVGVGFGGSAEPWGDAVNTAARFQSSAEAGQIVMSDRLFSRLSSASDATAKTVTLRGKREAEGVRVIEFADSARMNAAGRRD